MRCQNNPHFSEKTSRSYKKSSSSRFCLIRRKINEKNYEINFKKLFTGYPGMKNAEIKMSGGDRTKTNQNESLIMVDMKNKSNGFEQCIVQFRTMGGNQS